MTHSGRKEDLKKTFWRKSREQVSSKIHRKTIWQIVKEFLTNENSFRKLTCQPKEKTWKINSTTEAYRIVQHQREKKVTKVSQSNWVTINTQIALRTLLAHALCYLWFGVEFVQLTNTMLAFFDEVTTINHQTQTYS